MKTSLRKDQIIKYISNNPNSTSLDISNAIGIAIPSVRGHLRQIKQYSSTLIEEISTPDDRGRPYYTYRVNPNLPDQLRS